MLRALTDTRVILALMAAFVFQVFCCGVFTWQADQTAAEEEARLAGMTPEQQIDYQLHKAERLAGLVDPEAARDIAEFRAVSAELAEVGYGELTEEELEGSLELARRQAVHPVVTQPSGPSEAAPDGRLELETITFHPEQREEVSALPPGILAALVALSLGGAILLAGMVVSYMLYRGLGSGAEDPSEP